ncbi:hypothetical protein P3L10_032461 [Capsicum annuum]
MEDIPDEEGEWGGAGIIELESIPKVLGGETDKGGKLIELYNGISPSSATPREGDSCMGVVRE